MREREREICLSLSLSLSHSYSSPRYPLPVGLSVRFTSALVKILFFFGLVFSISARKRRDVMTTTVSDGSGSPQLVTTRNVSVHPPAGFFIPPTKVTRLHPTSTLGRKPVEFIPAVATAHSVSGQKGLEKEEEEEGGRGVESEWEREQWVGYGCQCFVADLFSLFFLGSSVTDCQMVFVFVCLFVYCSRYSTTMLNLRCSSP